MRQGATDIKLWILMGITPVLVMIIGYLIDKDLNSIKDTQKELAERLSKIEGLHEQVAVNTVNISNLKEDYGQTKQILQEHLAAVLPEETKVKRR